MKQDEETPAEGGLLLDLEVRVDAVDAIRRGTLKAKILAAGSASPYYKPGDMIRFSPDAPSLSVFTKNHFYARGLLAVEDVLSVEWAAEREPPADPKPEPVEFEPEEGEADYVDPSTDDQNIPA